jgi:hypothetical protein
VVLSAIFFWRRRQIRTRAVVKPFNEHPAESYPSSNERVPSNWQAPTLQCRKRLHSDGRGENHRERTTASLVPLGQPLPRKHREALDRASNSELAASNSTNANSGSGASGHENLVAHDTLRAEVEELRREMETIRSLARPPPEYR